MLKLRRRSSEIMAFCFFLTLTLFSLALALFNFSSLPVTFTQEQLIHIPPGVSTNFIGELLEREGIIKNAQFFKILVLLQKKESFLKSGYYRFNPRDNVFTIIDNLTKANVVRFKVTIPEGLTLEEISKILEKASGKSRENFLEVSQNIELDYSYLPSRLEEVDYCLQGYLFPATYDFPLDVTDKDIIKTMVARFHQELTPSMLKQVDKMGLSIHEFVTIASIIEKEGKYDKERPLISAVIHNRLQKGMYLQSCATVQYALPEWKARLLYEDLRFPSPYNTYLKAGLPPGPIASPGLASLEAAFFPADVDYLFFVALPDGSHQFSTSYQEHLDSQNN